MAKAGRYAAPKAEEPRGLFQDALADWTNDDVLQTEAARAALGARRPQALRVLDWPELRALFAVYDPPATRHGLRDRRFGLLSVGLAAPGLVLAMLSPLAVGAERVVEAAAAILVVAGLSMMGFHRFGASSKARWLAHRYGAERVRALYFQAAANNLDLMARAMTDDAALDAWKAARRACSCACLRPRTCRGRFPSWRARSQTTPRPGSRPSGRRRRARRNRRRSWTSCCRCSAGSAWTGRSTT